jgi:hypothetical protein
MSFETRRLPASLETGNLVGVLSLRGEKLTYLKDGYVYVVRSGEDPRAWRKAVDEKGNGTGPWQHCRPDCDVFLRMPSVFETTRRAMIEDWTKTRDREAGRREGLAENAFQPIWNRGRRADPWNRTVGAWKETFPDWAVEDDYSLSKRMRTRDILCRDYEEDTGDDYDRDHSLVSPMVTTDYLLDQHYQLRRLLRLNKISRWNSHFPPDALRFLETHNFSTRRWHLLNLWIRVPEGRELFDDLPQLAWLLASSWNIKNKPVRKPLRSLRSLVKKPRSAILKWLDLPGGKGTVKLLRRISPSDFSPMIAYWLREALRDDQSRSWLQNMEGKIDGKMLYLLGRRQPITFPIALSIHRDETAGPGFAALPVSLLYFHIRKMLRHMNREGEIRNLDRYSSRERLREWHDQLSRELNALPVRQNRTLSRAWEKVGNTMPPPLEPTDSMMPLGTPEALVEEGSFMSHCIATFSIDVARGEYYAYAIDYRGERATVGIYSRQKKWKLDELRGKHNGRVSHSLENYIKEWIHEASTGKPSPNINRLTGWEDEWIDDSNFISAGTELLTESDPF